MELHYYYEAAVQGIEYELDFATRIFKARYGRAPKHLREDFCGTAALACAWARRSAEHCAWGVDIDAETLEWGRKHHLAFLPSSAGTVTLCKDDVLTASVPQADVTLALNFSYCIFKTREALRDYFQTVRAGLKNEGAFVIDIYGGTEAIEAKREPRKIAKSVAEDGTKVPAFTYTWDQAEFNVVNHHVTNHIHFNIPGKEKIHKAFTYEWRLWTLPELCELMLEAGFANAEVYTSGWKKNGDSDDVYRKRTRFANSPGWLAYVVGTTS